ncbi:MAG TPA: alpha/beta hydrolase [Thermodesulfobacteriota bacterium]|nr:alpha/beta hydrolase [Thermodesulfobacteriota bacterium]
MSEPFGKIIRGDGIGIHLALWEGRGKDILAVHGLTANCRCWDAIARSVAPRHRFLAMDLRGRGLSDKPAAGYSIDIHARDILYLLDHLGLKQVVLMGHSLGAFISLVFAARYPERVTRLILVDGGGKLNADHTARVFAGIKTSLERLGKVFSSFDAYAGILRKAPFLQPWSQALENYFRYEVENVPGGVRPRIRPETIQEEIVNLTRLDVSHFYPQVHCPVLILRATEGVLYPDDILLPEDVVQRMVREIPKARRVDVEKTNHYSILFQDNPARDQAILQFLEEDGKLG